MKKHTRQTVVQVSIVVAFVLLFTGVTLFSDTTSAQISEIVLQYPKTYTEHALVISHTLQNDTDLYSGYVLVPNQCSQLTATATKTAQGYVILSIRASVPSCQTSEDLIYKEFSIFLPHASSTAVVAGVTLQGQNIQFALAEK